MLCALTGFSRSFRSRRDASCVASSGPALTVPHGAAASSYLRPTVLQDPPSYGHPRPVRQAIWVSVTAAALTSSDHGQPRIRRMQHDPGAFERREVDLLRPRVSARRKAQRQHVAVSRGVGAPARSTPPAAQVLLT